MLYALNGRKVTIWNCTVETTPLNVGCDYMSYPFIIKSIISVSVARTPLIISDIKADIYSPKQQYLSAYLPVHLPVHLPAYLPVIKA